MLLLLLVFLNGCGQGDAGDGRFQTVRVSQGALSQTVTASGTLGAMTSVDVGSQVSGKIAALRVDFNSSVHVGEVVAQIDPTVYQAALRQAEGELASANASLTLKRQNLERKRALLPTGAASRFDLDQAVAEVAQAEASVIIREAARDSARANLGYCTIVSPVEGVVISRKVDLGQTVISAMNTPVLFSIATTLTQMNISASVSEADIGRVGVGQKVQFTVDSFPDEEFIGEVSQVRRAPTVSQNVVTYETIIRVENPKLKLFPGMTAEVSIQVEERQKTIKVPNLALRYSPPEGVAIDAATATQSGKVQRLVYAPAARGGGLRAVPVRLGISDGIETEVLDGLAEGDAVVTATLQAHSSGPGFLPPGPPPAQ